MKVLKFDQHLAYDNWTNQDWKCVTLPSLYVCLFVCLFIFILFSLTAQDDHPCVELCYDLRMVICIFVSMFSWYFITRKTGSHCFIKSTALPLESYFPVAIAWVASLSLLQLFVYGIFFIAFDFNCASLKHLNTFLHGVQEHFFFSLEHLNPLSHELANARAKQCVLHCSRDYGASTSISSEIHSFTFWYCLTFILWFQAIVYFDFYCKL